MLHTDHVGLGTRRRGAKTKVKKARLSRACHQILVYLRETKGLHSANDIYVALRGELLEEAPGLTTVYRSLETLVKSEFIQEVNLGESERTFEFVEEGEHHHHLVCTACRESVHLDNCFVEQLESKIHVVHGFEVRSHILELFGLCPKCLALSELSLK
jgi:Fur family ferric uptake transcriptional regulator